MLTFFWGIPIWQAIWSLALQRLVDVVNNSIKLLFEVGDLLLFDSFECVTTSGNCTRIWNREQQWIIK